MDTTRETSHRSELNSTMNDAMWRGHGGWEMALVPALFGVLGWMLDRAVDTTPIFTIALAIVGLGGSVANQYYQYNHRMALAAEERKVNYDNSRGVAR